MSMCDCDDCGGVKDCGCATPEVVSSGSCSDGACSITSQSTAMQRSGTTVHPSAMRAFRGTRISGYDYPQMKVGPRAEPPQRPDVAGYSGPIVPPSGQALVLAAGQTPPAPITTPTPPPAPPPGAITSKPTSYMPQQQQQQQQQQVGVDPAIAQGLLNMGTTGIQGLTSLFTAMNAQANETERARFAAESQRQIAQLQRQGLLTQQQANDAMLAREAALTNLRDNPPPPPPPPQGWWEGLSTPAKVGVGVGAAAGVAGLGFLIYKATR